MKSPIASFLVILALGGAAAHADTLKIDPVHSTVGFKIRHLFANVTGRFTSVAGSLTVDPAHPENASVSAIIDIKSIDTASAMRDKDLRGSNFFEADKFPEMTFKSTKVQPLGGDKFKVTGDLTVHGVTKSVVLDAKLNKVGEHPMKKVQAIGFDATGTLKRSDFGVAAYVPNVSDEIKIHITTEGAVAPAGAAK